MNKVRLAATSVLTFAVITFAAHSSNANSISADIAAGNILVDSIVNIGHRTWKLVEKGNAVVRERPLVARALPHGVTDSNSLSGYKLRYLQARYEGYQPIGGTVHTYRYRVVFTYGGSLNGVGKYIGYATIEKVDLDARWLAPELDVWVSVPTTYNAGTAANPVAAMKIDIHFSAKRFGITETVHSYIIYGNGQITPL